MLPMPWLAPLAASFGSGLVLVLTTRSLAWRWGWVAEPKSDRWHRRPTALLGGVAIWAAVLFGMATAGGLDAGSRAILAGGTILCALGALDDRLRVKPATKVIAQLIASAVVFSFGVQTRLFDSPILNLATSCLWIVAITNAVNLLDNMDGLASGVVLIAAAYLGWIHAAAASPVETALAASLVGSLAAFLVFNFNPASIFMGDSGSMLIGFLLATLSLSTAEASNILSFVAVPALVLLVPILDTTLVTVTRVLRGSSIAEGGRDHTSHRLVMLGLSEREAVAVLWLIALVAGGSASLTRRYSLALGLGILPFIIIGASLLGIYLSRLRIVDEAVSGPLAAKGDNGNGYVRLALDFTYRRRVLEVLLDFVLIVASYYLAYGLRFDFDLSVFVRHRFYDTLPMVVAVTLLAFFYQGVYRGVWTYVDTAELVKYFGACCLAVLLGLATTTFILRFEHLSRSVFVIYGLLMFLGLAGTRLSFRLMDEALQRRRPGRGVLVVGAGSGGESAARELLRNAGLGLKVIGFADDDTRMHGRRVHGYTVVGGTRDLARVHDEIGFDEIVVATKKVSAEALERVRSFSESRQVSLRFFRIELLDAKRSAGARAAVPSGVATGNATERRWGAIS